MADHDNHIPLEDASNVNDHDNHIPLEDASNVNDQQPTNVVDHEDASNVNDQQPTTVVDHEDASNVNDQQPTTVVDHQPTNAVETEENDFAEVDPMSITLPPEDNASESVFSLKGQTPFPLSSDPQDQDENNLGSDEDNDDIDPAEFNDFLASLSGNAADGNNNPFGGIMEMMKSMFPPVPPQTTSSSKGQNSSPEQEIDDLRRVAFEQVLEYFDTLGIHPTGITEVVDAVISFHEDNRYPYNFHMVMYISQLLAEHFKLETAIVCDCPRALLRIFIDPVTFDGNEGTISIDTLKTHIAAHNKRVLENKYPDAGFDLLAPKSLSFPEGHTQTQFLDHGIVGAMESVDGIPTAFYLYPRSSISKTPLTLANSTGIIDSGYRGHIMAALRSNATGAEYTIEPGHRIAQLCHPTLCPIYVYLVDSIEQLSESTERGAGGFGSTN